MSQSPTRSTVFLQEMGIGVQWKVRTAPASDGFAEAVQALADEAPPAPVMAAEAPPPSARHAAPPMAEVDVPQAEPAPVRSALVAAVEAASARNEAPAAPPPAATADEDMSWFDDAPMSPPAAAPSRPAVPARPATGQPPAPARAAPRPAAAADLTPPDEDTSWFDDAPMPPPAAAPSHPSAAATSHPAPAARPAPAGLPSPTAAPSHLPPAAPQPAAPVSDEAIAQMDWPALQAAVSSCTRCTLCETRVAAVNGRGAQNATWIAIAGAPSAADEQDAQAVTGEAGQLLHNMLKAIALKPESEVYVTNVVKCRPPERNPGAEEVIACRPFLDRELALTGAIMAMTFGQFAARGLMMGPATRGQVMHYHDLPVVATYHPDDLLRKPEDKAKAWADLCLAKASHA